MICSLKDITHIHWTIENNHIDDTKKKYDSPFVRHGGKNQYNGYYYRKNHLYHHNYAKLPANSIAIHFAKIQATIFKINAIVYSKFIFLFV